MPEGYRPRRSCRATLLLTGLFIFLSSVVDADTDVGGDFRLYPFLFLEDVPLDRSELELAVLRGKLTADLTEHLRVEAHGVLELSSPPISSPSTSVVSGETRRYFDLQETVIDSPDLLGVVSFDRLNLRWDQPGFRLTAGRQAVTWGVNYFWPVLDLFAPFAPERIDRDYKPGVDALRLTVPVGDFSEIELIGAMQGDDTSEDGSLASLGRFHAGRTDFGYMLGHFHGDNVGGLFVATDAAGTALRVEAAFTDSDERSFLDSREESFWRASVGADRQLTPYVVVSAEAYWNGSGASDPDDYLRVAQSDRVQRGEVTSLGRVYSGVSLTWQIHPLRTLSAVFLTNWTDGSSLFQPGVSWSLSNNATLRLGLIVGFGPGSELPNPASADSVAPVSVESEYGLIPLTMWGSYGVYF